MIQRIQSIYLLLAATLNVGILLAPFWQFQDASNVEVLSGLSVQLANNSTPSTSFTENYFHLAGVGFTALLSLYIGAIIFGFNNRKRQMKLGNVALILIMVEILVWIMFTRQGPFILASAKNLGMAQWGLIFPVLSLIFTWLAIRGIKKDDDLVRSMDRIR